MATQMGLEPTTSSVTGWHSKPTELLRQVRFETLVYSSKEIRQMQGILFLRDFSGNNLDYKFLFYSAKGPEKNWNWRHSGKRAFCLQ